MSNVVIRSILDTHFASIAPIIAASSIQSVVPGTVALFKTSAPHQLKSGLVVAIEGHTGSTPAITGLYEIVVVDSTTFSLKNSATGAAIGVTIAGNGGSVSASLTVTPNSAFQGVVGVPYQEVSVMFAQPYEPTQGGGYRKEVGIYQVTLVYPTNIGTGAIGSRADLIKASFKKGLSLSKNGIKLTIPRTPRLDPEYGRPEVWCQPISIPFEAEVFD